jgi:hypothetical protein
MAKSQRPVVMDKLSSSGGVKVRHGRAAARLQVVDGWQVNSMGLGGNQQKKNRGA